jgi:hypothetical protein
MYFDRCMYAVYERALVWLSEHQGMSQESLEAKYPGFITAMQEEDNQVRRALHYCPVDWAFDQDGTMPDLLTENLHRGRLGQVIDEVLHLTPK